MREHRSLARLTIFWAALFPLFLAAGVRAQDATAQKQNPPAQVTDKTSPGNAPTSSPADLVKKDNALPPDSLKTGGAGQTVTADPPSLTDFADRDLDMISEAKVVTLKTNTSTAVTIGGIGVSDNFILRDNNCQTAIPPGVNGCQITIAFRPIHTGDVSGKAIIPDADGKPLATIELKGKGLAPADCGLSRKSQSWYDLFWMFLPPFILVVLFFVGIVVVRWNLIARPTQNQLRSQIDAVRSRLIVLPASARKDAIGDLLNQARVTPNPKLSISKILDFILDRILWSRGYEMSGWGRVHEAEEQMASLLPPEQVRARLESCVPNLRKLNTPDANANADTVQSVLNLWSSAGDCSWLAIHHALEFLTSQFPILNRADRAPNEPPPASDPLRTLPDDVGNSMVPKAKALLEEIDQCLATTPAPPEPRLSVLKEFRTALATQIPLLSGAAQQVIAAFAASAAQTPPDSAKEALATAWTAFLAVLKNSSNARAGWTQGLQDTRVPEYPPVARGRAVLQEALHVIYDNTDTELSIYEAWQNQGMWMTGCALLLIVVLAGPLQNGILFLAGGLGGLLSRLNRELKRSQFTSDYGASWMTLFLAPVVGALTGWAGVLLVSILKDFGIVGYALKVEWCKPYAPISLGLAVAFGFSERLFDTIIGQLDDRVAAQKTQATSSGPAPLKITLKDLPPGKAGQPYAATLKASGGTEPYTLRITTGQLPPALSMDSSGAITGVPANEGTFPLSVQVTDKDSKTDSGSFTIKVTK